MCTVNVFCFSVTVYICTYIYYSQREREANFCAVCSKTKGFYDMFITVITCKLIDQCT